MNNLRTLSPEKRGFTLIELLVVIAIIAILAAILFPVFAQAKQAAHKAVDISNLKQQSLALMMYHEDWDGELVRTSVDLDPDGIVGDSYRVYWIQFVYPYVKNAGVFLSPADPKPMPVELDVPVKYNSYISNYAVMPAHDFKTVNESVINTPSDVIFLAQRRSVLMSKSEYKGTSGFWPGEPCTAGIYARKFTIAAMPRGGTYVRMTEQQARKDLPTQLLASDNKINQLNRTYWDIYGNGSVFAMGDGHAKFLPIGATTNPDHFLWGEYFYSQSILPGEDPLQPSGSNCD